MMEEGMHASDRQQVFSTTMGCNSPLHSNSKASPDKSETLPDGDPTHLPITVNGTGHARGWNRKKLTLFPLIFLMFFEAAGGPYGAEPAVQAGGPLLAPLGFSVFSFVWAVPECLVTAELSAAMPGNGGYVVWVGRAFGPFAGSLIGTWKYIYSAVDAAAFPAPCSDYLAVSHGGARVATIVTFNVALTSLCYTGLSVIALGMSFLSFGSIVAVTNFVYGLGVLLEFAALFVWLCARRPDMPRPYRVPVGTAGVSAMCAVPSAFLVLVMAVAGWKVWLASAAFTGGSVVVYFVMAFCKARGCLKFRRAEEGDLELEGCQELQEM